MNSGSFLMKAIVGFSDHEAVLVPVPFLDDVLQLHNMI